MVRKDISWGEDKTVFSYSMELFIAEYNRFVYLNLFNSTCFASPSLQISNLFTMHIAPNNKMLTLFII